MFSSVPFVTVKWDLSKSYFHSIYKHLIIRLTARRALVVCLQFTGWSDSCRLWRWQLSAQQCLIYLSIVAVGDCTTIGVRCIVSLGRIEMGLMNYFALQAQCWTCTWIHCSWIFQHLEHVPTHDRPLPMTNSSSIWVSAVCIYKALWASSAPANPTFELHLLREFESLGQTVNRASNPFQWEKEREREHMQKNIGAWGKARTGWRE